MTPLLYSLLKIILGIVLMVWGCRLIIQGRKQIASRREAIVQRVYKELLVNVSIIESKAFNETNEELLLRFANFPRLHTAGLDEAENSRLLERKNDQNLLVAIINLKDLLIDFNQKLTAMEQEFRERPKETVSSLKQVREDSVFQDIRTQLGKLETLLAPNLASKLEGKDSRQS